MLHEGAEVRMTADERRGLGGVDQSCGEFTGLVDAELQKNQMVGNWE